LSNIEYDSRTNHLRFIIRNQADYSVDLPHLLFYAETSKTTIRKPLIEINPYIKQIYANELIEMHYFDKAQKFAAPFNQCDYPLAIGIYSENIELSEKEKAILDSSENKISSYKELNELLETNYIPEHKFLSLLQTSLTCKNNDDTTSQNKITGNVIIQTESQGFNLWDWIISLFQ
jgi:hypothetical protein